MGSDPLPTEVHLLGGLDKALRERQAAAEHILHDLTTHLDRSSESAYPQDAYPASEEPSSHR
jgi:hypothetical protein